MDFQLFDKIIPSGYADQIEHDLMYTHFPWYYINDVTNKNYGNNSGFTHVVYEFGGVSSDWLPFIKPIIYNIEDSIGHRINKLLRIRIGFLPKTSEPNHDYNTPHVDFLMSHWTACYYVNDCDGDTVLFDKTLDDVSGDMNDQNIINFVEKNNFEVIHRNSPKKGSLFLFNGKIFHSSTKPKNSERRLVITINYI
jgi:Putative 2OG-Fe(II) oxygenase